MNQSNINAIVDNLYQYSEKESPPFALDEHLSSLKEKHHTVLHGSPGDFSKPSPSQPPFKNENEELKCAKSMEINFHKNNLKMKSNLRHSSPSPLPDLTESNITDGTSLCSVLSVSNSDITKSINRQINKSPPPSPLHPTAISSIFSTASLTSVPLESQHLPDSNFYPANHGSPNTTAFTEPDTIDPQSERNSRSIGFSELMMAADDSSMELGQSRQTVHIPEHRSNERLPPLLESQEVESGTLISAAPEPNFIPNFQPPSRPGYRKWWHNMPFLDSTSYIANPEFERPLLTAVSGSDTNGAATRQPHITRLLSNDSFQNQQANLALQRACATVQTKIESDESFEVSLLLEPNAQFTVDDVMEVISNTDLLNLWCDPIETLIVTSNTSGVSLDGTQKRNERIRLSNDGRNDNERIREYEGEWIEATSSPLESPSGGLSIFLGAGQSILETLGFASYGRITMFIERRRGHIGLTIGPFHGGIHASHTINVSSQCPSSTVGKIKIVDRVRLTHEDKEVSLLGKVFGCGVGSCLSQLFLPSIGGYMDQVTLSLGRLRILLENVERK